MIFEKQVQKLVKVAKQKTNLKIETKTPLERVDNNILRRFRSLAPLPQQMKLIWPSKQKVGISMNIVKSSLQKQMQVNVAEM